MAQLRDDRPEQDKGPLCSACSSPAGDYRDSWGGANLCDSCCRDWLAHLEAVWDELPREVRRSGPMAPVFAGWLESRKRAMSRAALSGDGGGQ